MPRRLAAYERDYHPSRRDIGTLNASNAPGDRCLGRAPKSAQPKHYWTMALRGTACSALLETLHR